MRCIRDFAARADVRMRVCGACGLRDPGDACEREVVLAELSSEHWLHVGNSILFHNWKIACFLLPFSSTSEAEHKWETADESRSTRAMACRILLSSRCDLRYRYYAQQRSFLRL